MYMSREEEYELYDIRCEDDLIFFDEFGNKTISDDEVIRIIENNLREYWRQFPNELRPKYYQDQWYLDGESSPYIEF